MTGRAISFIISLWLIAGRSMKSVGVFARAASNFALTADMVARTVVRTYVRSFAINAGYTFAPNHPGVFRSDFAFGI